LESARLRLQFLEVEIENSFAVMAMAKTNSSLGYHEAAARGMVLARKGHQMAKYLHRTLAYVSPATLTSLSKRLDVLGLELGPEPVPDPVTHDPVSQELHIREHSTLTAREIEVLALIVEGKSTKELAGILGISFKTAVCHRSHIMSKLGVQNAAALVRKAILEGLITPVL